MITEAVFVCENSRAMERERLLYVILLICVILPVYSSVEKRSGSAFKAKLQRVDAGMSQGKRMKRAAIVSRRRIQETLSRLKYNEEFGETGNFESPVISSQGAEWLMELQLGTPVQTFRVIADTGSDLTWLHCHPCTSCNKKNPLSCKPCHRPLFDPSKSSSYNIIPSNTPQCCGLDTATCSNSSSACHFDYGYTDLSFAQGDYATETLTLNNAHGHGGLSTFNLIVGCGYTTAGGFFHAQGLAGLGQGRISLTSQLDFAINGKFSYCFVNSGLNISSHLLFGEVATLYGDAHAGVSSTPILPNPFDRTSYYVQLQRIRVGNVIIRPRAFDADLNRMGTLFDSGTTLTMFDASVYNQLVDAFARQVALPRVHGIPYFDLCFDISQKGTYNFPAITLVFKGAFFNPPTQNYIDTIDDDGKVACLLMGNTGNSGIGVIGNLLQQDFHIAYDVHNLIISFQPTDCSSL